MKPDGLTLPDAPWRHWPGLDRLTAALGTGNARVVGGAVRDTLLGIPVSDLDIATPLDPQEVMRRLERAGIKVIPTGIVHGTITAVSSGTVVEVTTLRRDVTTDGRRATVAFTDDWKEDAARRDFTINALYADPDTGEVFDYFGGRADLAARHVRFIGDPLRRIAEDHLRILRFFRFLARFGDSPDAASLDACTARANDLMALSRERIADELLKLMVAKDAVRVIALMLERGIFRPVLPEIASVERFARVEALESEAGIEADPIRRLAALLPADASIAESVGGRLKLSNAQRKRLIAATDADLFGAPRAAAYRLGRDEAIDRLFLFDAEDAVAAARDLIDWEIPRLPLAGGALIQRGLTKGPDVARALRAVESQWIEEGFPDAARVEQIADAVTDQALRSTSSE
ncbi:CCA tRNA nucleotidyltransferase [Sphingomonas sp. J344]|nr:CCA tRNA nucleotidyltransferase [Sphingomonas sp. J344]MCR5869993.1 CCA tRNA nucleotidyltransferase [Sphingomonas sp. J344]